MPPRTRGNPTDATGRRTRADSVRAATTAGIRVIAAAGTVLADTTDTGDQKPVVVFTCAECDRSSHAYWRWNRVARWPLPTGRFRAVTRVEKSPRKSVTNTGGGCSYL